MTSKHLNVSGVRLRLADRAVTPEEMLALVAKEPARAVQAIRGGVRIEAEPAVLALLATTPIGSFLADDGQVTTSAVTGIEEIIVAEIVGACIGFVIGLGVGILASQAGKDQTTDDSHDTTDSGDDDDGDGADNGGDGGNDGGGGEGP
jgi:hypothetical protein